MSHHRWDMSDASLGITSRCLCMAESPPGRLRRNASPYYLFLMTVTAAESNSVKILDTFVQKYRKEQFVMKIKPSGDSWQKNIRYLLIGQ